MSDYRINEDGTVVTILSERAANRGVGPKPAVGTEIEFRTKYDTKAFVRTSKIEGYAFEGDELLAGA